MVLKKGFLFGITGLTVHLYLVLLHVVIGVPFNLGSGVSRRSEQ